MQHISELCFFRNSSTAHECLCPCLTRTIGTPTPPAAQGLGFGWFLFFFSPRIAPVLCSGFWVSPHPSPPPLTSISPQAEAAASEAVPVRALLAASHHVAYRHFSRCSALQNPRNPSQEKYSVEISPTAQPTSNTAEPEPVRKQASKRQAGKQPQIPSHQACQRCYDIFFPIPPSQLGAVSAPLARPRREDAVLTASAHPAAPSPSFSSNKGAKMLFKSAVRAAAGGCSPSPRSDIPAALRRLAHPRAAGHGGGGCQGHGCRGGDTGGGRDRSGGGSRRSGGAGRARPCTAERGRSRSVIAAGLCRTGTAPAPPRHRPGPAAPPAGSDRPGDPAGAGQGRAGMGRDGQGGATRTRIPARTRRDAQPWHSPALGSVHSPVLPTALPCSVLS